MEATNLSDQSGYVLVCGCDEVQYFKSGWSGCVIIGVEHSYVYVWAPIVPRPSLYEVVPAVVVSSLNERMPRAGQCSFPPGDNLVQVLASQLHGSDCTRRSKDA